MENHYHPLHGKSITSAKQFAERTLLLDFFERADLCGRHAPSQKLADKIVKVWFYQASTRTRDLIETAVHRLGGMAFGPSDAAKVSSFVKTGETIEDTMHIISCHADAVALRHPEDDAGPRAAKVLEQYGKVLIDAGSGTYEHPIQGLKDAYAFRNEFGTIDGIKIAIYGDLRNNRVVRSQIFLMAPVAQDIEYIFVSQDELRVASDITDYLKEHGVRYREHDRLQDVIGVADAFYGLRLQKEAFESAEECKALMPGYPNFTLDMALKLRARDRLFHPGPRGPELGTNLDQLPQFAYFRQARGGYHIGEALFDITLSI